MCFSALKLNLPTDTAELWIGMRVMESFNMLNGWTSAARILAITFKSFNCRRGKKAHFITYVCLKIIKLWLCMAKSLLRIQTVLHKSVWMSRGKTYVDDSKIWTTKSLNTGPSARMLSYSCTNDDAKLLSEFYNCSQTLLLQNGDKHWQIGALWLDYPRSRCRQCKRCTILTLKCPS